MTAPGDVLPQRLEGLERLVRELIRNLDSQERRAVEIRRKDDAVVSVALSLDVLEETWRADALFDEGPRHRRRNGRRSLCLGNLVELQ